MKGNQCWQNGPSDPTASSKQADVITAPAARESFGAGPAITAIR